MRKFRYPERTKQSLIAERSAIYGYLAVERARASTGEDFWSDYLAARVASGKAIGLGIGTITQLKLLSGRGAMFST